MSNQEVRRRSLDETIGNILRCAEQEIRGAIGRYHDGLVSGEVVVPVAPLPVAEEPNHPRKSGTRTRSTTVVDDRWARGKEVEG